ncbi:MAG TPA: phosphatase PAP2 family protein [Nocardioides sp.]|uniref:phosphatase PAP2 family protein n=1 Tax=Nocardioides sp. TaxID=35761 RepID=UPI002EDA9574
MGRARAYAAGGLLLAYAGLAVGFAREPGRREQAVFTRANGGGRRPWLRVPQQWGTPWTLPAVAAVATARGRPVDAAVALACLPVEKGLEVATKKLRPRPRPLYVLPTHLRDDAPLEGGAMPSGHAALAACGTTLLLPAVPPWARAALAALTGLSAYVRVHQGAHHPTDAVAGLVLGVGVALGVSEAAARLAAR